MGIQPLQNHLLLEPDDSGVQKQGALYIPDTNNNGMKKGTVVAVGPGKTTANGVVVPIGLSVGDYVLYAAGAAVEIPNGATKYALLSEDQIIAKITK